MNPFLLTDLPFWSAPFGIRLLECIEYRKGITALDIGFGTGFPLIEIAMRLGEGSIVIGIDPNREMVELVNAKIAELPSHLADPILQLTPMPVNFHSSAGELTVSAYHNNTRPGGDYSRRIALEENILYLPQR